MNPEEINQKILDHKQAYCSGKFMALTIVHIARCSSKTHYKQFVDEIYKLTKDMYVIETEHDNH